MHKGDFESFLTPKKGLVSSYLRTLMDIDQNRTALFLKLYKKKNHCSVTCFSATFSHKSFELARSDWKVEIHADYVMARA